MLFEIFNSKLKEITEPGMFSTFPKCTDREEWEKPDSELRVCIISEAEELIGYGWPRMKATDYLEYYRIGSRKSYDKIFKMNFDAMTKLVMGECVEGKGRFLDNISNGIIARCEETSWIHTGHLRHYGDEQIPRHDGTYLDLRACSTGSQLALVYYLLKSELDGVSPYLCNRIEYEIKVRILDNYLENDYWWMNLTEGGTINNWNTHCNKNVMLAALIMEKDDKRIRDIMAKICRSLDVFLSIHKADGACDEGPGYWKGSGFSFLNILNFLAEVYKIPVESFLDQRIENMGSYIYKVFIHDDFYMSYADGNGRNPMLDVKLFRTSAALGDERLEEMSIDLFKKHRARGKYYEYFIYILFDYIEYTLNYNEIKLAVQKSSEKKYYLKDAVLENAHIFAARQSLGSEKGFFTGLKGGHNEESHNHNDIGVFYLYYNGQPVVIDAGASEYTIKTFSPNRYDIWTMQSAWHSLPVVNGFMQKEGRNYCSALFETNISDSLSRTSMEISGAYPEEAMIKAYSRSLTIDRELSAVRLYDDLGLKEISSQVIWHFTLAKEPVISEAGDIEIAAGNVKIMLEYNKKRFKPLVEKKKLSKDKKLSESWGDSIYRLSFESLHKEKSHKAEFAFKAGGEL